MSQRPQVFMHGHATGMLLTTSIQAKPACADCSIDQVHRSESHRHHLLERGRVRGPGARKAWSLL